MRTARYAINAAHASGNITDEQHAEAIRKLLTVGHTSNASPAVQPERQRKARGWLRRLFVGFGALFLLMVAVIVTVSVLANFLPPQKPTSAQKYAVLHKTLA
jgi:anti-sigma factor RsiW